MQSLRQGMNEWARNLASQNVSEEALVVIRRDRLCVPVKAGRQVSYSAIAPAKPQTQQGTRQCKSGLLHASVLDLNSFLITVRRASVLLKCMFWMVGHGTGMTMPVPDLAQICMS